MAYPGGWRHAGGARSVSSTRECAPLRHGSALPSLSLQESLHDATRGYAGGARRLLEFYRPHSHCGVVSKSSALTLAGSRPSRGPSHGPSRVRRAVKVGSQPGRPTPRYGGALPRCHPCRGARGQADHLPGRRDLGGLGRCGRPPRRRLGRPPRAVGHRPRAVPQPPFPLPTLYTPGLPASDFHVAIGRATIAPYRWDTCRRLHSGYTATLCMYATPLRRHALARAGG